MKIKKLFVLSLFLAAGIFFKSDSAFAATKTWAGGGSDNNFDTAANWSPSGAPSNGDSLVFDTSTAVTRSDPVNNMSGLSVSSITFIGSGLDGVHTVTATTPLTVTGPITDSAAVDSVTHVAGTIILGDDVITRGVSFEDGAGAIQLNSHTLTFKAALGQQFIIGLETPITGTGTVVLDHDDETVDSGAQIQFGGVNTYSGTTIYKSGSVLTLTLTPNQIFGTSSITIDPNAQLSLSLPDAANNTSWDNPITIAATNKANWVNDFASLFISSRSGNALSLSIPNMTLQSDSRMTAGDNVTVNLAGINAGGFCVEYGNYDSYSNTWTGGSSFLNGPPHCVLSAATTKPKVPDTGYGLLLNNPALVAGLTGTAAVAILAIARRQKVATRRSRR